MKKNFLKNSPAIWRDFMAAALVIVAVLGTTAYGWWAYEMFRIVLSPPGKGLQIQPPWIGLGGLATAVAALIIKNVFFSRSAKR